ncbi:LPXTG cell wall anchor domain-containing protein [Streptococcus halichoeri]|uniref:LPXTG cell wall anchor domain-containing protein n=1 Tax=Streptococcus halichoeri TaxID=254785 RepID=UPI00135C3F6E|nr:proline-rich domain-containing protein [Streptococcus halichoeri]
MAKHHWNWTKKAVLASLMLGASVLVSSTGVNAEEKFEVKEPIKKQAFNTDQLTLASISASDDTKDHTQKIINILASLDTKTMLKFFDNYMHPSSEPENSRLDVLNDLENLLAPTQATINSYNGGNHNADGANGDIIEYFRKHPGLGLHHVISADGSNNHIPFTDLLVKEIARRLANYHAAVDSIKNFSQKGKDIETQLTETKQAQEKLQSEIHNKEKEVNSLKEQSDKFKSQLNTSENTQSDLQHKTKELEVKLQQVSTTLTASEDAANALNKQIEKALENNSELQTKLNSETHELTNLQRQLTSEKELSTEEKAKLQTQLEEKQAEVNQLQAKVDESKATLDKLTTEKAEADAKVAELTAEKDKLTQEKNSIQTQLNSQTELSAEEKAKLEKQLADIQSKIAEKDASIKSLEGQLDTLKRQEHDTTPSTPEAPQVPEVKPEDKSAEPQQPETKPQAPHAPETGKPSTPKKPEIKPAPAVPEVKPSTPHTPEKPGKGKPAAPKANHSKAHHAATPATPHMAAPSTQKTAAHLPQTGETTANPFFTVAALSIIASAGVLATKRKED